MAGRIVAIANQKGGVGKTTTGINLSAALARTSRRVLLVDLDPQGNATVGSGVNKDSITGGAYELLLGRAEFPQVRLSVKAGYDLIPSNGHLSGAEVELVNASRREFRLKTVLAAADYDYVFIDCPPALNLLTVNALTAAHSVLIPMQCEYFALEGLSALVNTVRRVRAQLNPGLVIEGLLRTLFDARNGLSNEVSLQLARHFGDKLYRTVIPRNVRLAEAPSHAVSVLEYDLQSRGAQAYIALAGEILRREAQSDAETAPES
ncbi:MAG: ParA family protein [Acidiferrobacteraceae bacterium]